LQISFDQVVEHLDHPNFKVHEYLVFQVFGDLQPIKKGMAEQISTRDHMVSSLILFLELTNSMHLKLLMLQQLGLKENFIFILSYF
jgi:hypothetical protein